MATQGGKDSRLVDYVLLSGIPSHAPPFYPDFQADELLEKRFQPKPLARVPKEEHEDQEFPVNVDCFVAPQGSFYSKYNIADEIHSFVLTKLTGEKVYGFCYTRYTKEGEEGKGIEGAQEGETLFCPRYLVILSSFPYHDEFLSFLHAFFSTTAPSGPLLASHCLQIWKLLGEGKREQSFQVIKLEKTEFFSELEITFPVRIASTELPVGTNQYNILFETLSPGRVLFLLSLLLNEGKVVFISNSAAKLTICLEALMSLLYPFEWPHVYVPVLPLNMLLFFEAPLPFVFGVFPEALKMVELSPGTVVVDLSDGTLTTEPNPDGTKWQPVPLPSDHESELRSFMEQCAADIGFSDDTIIPLPSPSPKKGRSYEDFDEGEGGSKLKGKHRSATLVGQLKSKIMRTESEESSLKPPTPVSKTQSKGQRLIRKEISEDSKKLLRVCEISPYVPTSLQEEAQWLRTSIVSVFLKLFQPLFLYTSLASKKKPQSHLEQKMDDFTKADDTPSSTSSSSSSSPTSPSSSSPSRPSFSYTSSSLFEEATFEEEEDFDNGEFLDFINFTDREFMKQFGETQLFSYFLDNLAHRDTVFNFMMNENLRNSFKDLIELSSSSTGGCFYKMGHVVKNWKLRYFYLNGLKLLYYHKKEHMLNGKQALGVINIIPGLTKIRIPKRVEKHFEEIKEAPHPFILCIQTPPKLQWKDQKTMPHFWGKEPKKEQNFLALCFEDDDMRRQWFSVLSAKATEAELKNASLDASASWFQRYTNTEKLRQFVIQVNEKKVETSPSSSLPSSANTNTNTDANTNTTTTAKDYYVGLSPDTIAEKFADL